MANPYCLKAHLHCFRVFAAATALELIARGFSAHTLRVLPSLLTDTRSQRYSSY